ncbi:MAG: hypothetical protein AB1649_17700 [Chloroflexota bacterium]
MQLETISAWSQIFGTLIAILGFIFGIWLEWPKIKERVKGNVPPADGRKTSSLLVRLAIAAIIIGILLFLFGSTLKELLKDLSPALPFPAFQERSSDLQMTALNTGLFTEEVISITNNSENQLALYRWMILKNGERIFTFPQTFIKPHQSIDLYTRSGVDSTTSLHMNYFNPILQSGDVITLADIAGTQRATYQIP